MSRLLQVEIIRRVFEDFGISVESGKVMHDLIISDNTRCEFTLPLEVDGTTTAKPIWSAQLDLAGTKIRVIMSDVSDDVFSEFVLAFTATDLPLYGIRLSSDPEDDGLFDVKAGGAWVPVTIGIQASVLSALEQVTGSAQVWTKSDNIDDLHEALISFLNSGDES